MPEPRQSWPWKHPVLTTIGTVLVLIVLIAAISGKNTQGGSTSTVTETQTVARRPPRHGRTRVIIRRAPTHTITVTSTITSTCTPSASAPAPSPAAIEGPGSASHATDAQFCSTHACIPNFPNGHGTIVQCADGQWSHSGGLSGACSSHGGES